jgi:CDGSH-type Zn-finger protein
MEPAEGMKITVTEDGPYRVEGSVPLAPRTIVANDDGDSLDWRDGDPIPTKATYLLCRCGQSNNKPFCDDSHLAVEFDGTEVAQREAYLDMASIRRGPTLQLTDVQSLCASARFCDVAPGIQKLVATKGAAAAESATHQAQCCPSGRLVLWDPETNQPLEPDYEPSIGLVIDPAAGVSGPLAVRGGIRLVSDDGYEYEVRNRMTLCRCGHSSNKPFCDGTHIDIGFQA